MGLVLIEQFNGGMVNDLRSGWSYGKISTTNKYSVAKHFDLFTFPNKLRPQFATETASSDSAATQRTNNILQLLYAPYNATTTYQLYGYGVSSGHPSLFIYNIDSGTDLDSLAWTSATNGTCSNGSQNAGVFIYYKSYVYFMQSALRISRYKITATASLTENWQNFGAGEDVTNPTQAVHHPSDDMLYFFSKNHVYSWNDSSWVDALTLPSDMTIRAACAFGNYLAIGMTSDGSEDKKSIVFLWDRDSSLTTLTERLDFGAGILMYLANLNGRLIGVMNYYGNSTLSLNRGKLLIKTQSGPFGKVLNELELGSTFTIPITPTNFYVEDNVLYFIAAAPLSDDTRYGIWSVDENGRLGISVMEANATQVSYYNCIFKTGQLFWIGYFDGTGNVISRTNDEGTYSASLASVYETLIFNNGDASQGKQLVGVTVMTEPLPTIGEIILKYRRNVQNPDGTFTAETSWTTIFDNTTDNSLAHDAVNIESSGNPLPPFNEIQFRIESYGGAVITGLRFAFDVIENAPYQP